MEWSNELLEFLEDNPEPVEVPHEGRKRSREDDDSRERSRSKTPINKRRARNELSSADKKSLQKPKVFQDSWLSDAHFKGWVEKVPGDRSLARCAACNKTIQAGKSELEKHAEGKKHKSNVESVKTNKTVASMFNPNTPAQKHAENVKRAEIQMAAFFADNNIAFRTADQLVGVQKKSFKDSKVVQDMTLGHDKCNAIVRNVIAKCETEELVEDLRNSLFTIMIDESTDRGGDKSLIVIVRYMATRNPWKDSPRTTMLELIRLDARNCSAEKLWDAFRTALEEKHRVPVTNCIGMGSDSAAVMVGGNNSFWSRLKEVCPWAILIPCTCHSAAKVSSYACSKLPPNVEDHLRMLATYLGGSPKRSAELQEFQQFYEEELAKILKPCATRWLVLQPCVERYLKLRKEKSLTGFFELRCFEDPKMKDKDAHKILAELKNPFTLAYMEFLGFVLNVTNEFNALFQSKSVLIHKLYERSHNLMKVLCMNFMKEEYLDRLGTINVTHPNYLLPEDDVELGPGCVEALKNIRPSSDTPETRRQLAQDIKVFKQRCLHFYTTAAQEIQARLPLNNELIKQMSFLDPEVLLGPRSDPGGLNNINALICHFKDKIDLDPNGVALEWRKAPLVITAQMKEKFKGMPVEAVWHELRDLQNGGGDSMFPNLWKLARVVMIQPHANADAERGFSIVTDVRTNKRNRMGAACLNAICVCRTSFRSKGIDCVSFEVGPQHLAKHNKDMYKTE